MYRNDLIKAKKAVLDYSIENICSGANLSPMTVHKILKGEQNIDFKSLVAVAEFLEIPISDLFSDKEIAQAM